MALDIRQLRTTDAGFAHQLETLTRWVPGDDRDVDLQVRSIVDQVRQRGDEALVEFTRRFDGHAPGPDDLRVSRSRIERAMQRTPPELLEALHAAAARIRAFHEKQKQASWDYVDSGGTRLGQKITPLGAVGVYVPGGKAAYPSTVLMNTIPATVAGVSRIVMTVPAPGGELSDVVLAAASIAGVHEIYTVGGAQAVAALAYGTDAIARVDKIVGPGNQYVASAKKMVFGDVGLDMVAGPSEILIVCDGSASPDWLAMDLFSQAEHDEQAQSILISTDASQLQRVLTSMQRLLPEMERASIIEQALRDRGALIHAASLTEAFEIANRIAPEHLEIATENAPDLLDAVQNAGAVFLGHYTPEAMGDYCAGPNHVLPTSGTARFASPLGVYDFQKRCSILACSEASAKVLGDIASRLADSESLTAHARSARMRIGREQSTTGSPAGKPEP